MPQIIIQHVLHVWTKQSRGGEAARRRNALPTAVKLPNPEWNSPFVLHKVVFSEYNDFKPTESLKTSAEFKESGMGDLAVICEHETARVRFLRDGFNAACPSPFPYKDAFTLLPGKWGRVAYNGRYVDFSYGTWWYELSTFNIGYFDRCSVNIFTSTSPVNEFQEMVKLR